MRNRKEARLSDASPENTKLMSDILEETLVEGAVEKVCKDMNMSDDQVQAHVHFYRAAVKTGLPSMRKPEDVILIGEVWTHATEMYSKSKAISKRQLELIQKANKSFL